MVQTSEALQFKFAVRITVILYPDKIGAMIEAAFDDDVVIVEACRCERLQASSLGFNLTRKLNDSLKIHKSERLSNGIKLVH